MDDEDSPQYPPSDETLTHPQNTDATNGVDPVDIKRMSTRRFREEPKENSQTDPLGPTSNEISTASSKSRKAGSTVSPSEVSPPAIPNLRGDSRITPSHQPTSTKKTIDKNQAKQDLSKTNNSTFLCSTDPNAITLRFLFANRDGLNVNVECQFTDTIGEVKGALLSVWPDSLQECTGGENIRLICMGKGMLMPDSKTLQDFQIPVFKTHATPVNVSVKPQHIVAAERAQKSSAPAVNEPGATPTVSQGCACIIL